MRSTVRLTLVEHRWELHTIDPLFSAALYLAPHP